jgi:hypothetical protein
MGRCEQIWAHPMANNVDRSTLFRAAPLTWPSKMTEESKRRWFRHEPFTSGAMAI